MPAAGGPSGGGSRSSPGDDDVLPAWGLTRLVELLPCSVHVWQVDGSHFLSSFPLCHSAWGIVGPRPAKHKLEVSQRISRTLEENLCMTLKLLLFFKQKIDKVYFLIKKIYCIMISMCIEPLWYFYAPCVYSCQCRNYSQKLYFVICTFLVTVTLLLITVSCCHTIKSSWGNIGLSIFFLSRWMQIACVMSCRLTGDVY